MVSLIPVVRPSPAVRSAPLRFYRRLEGFLNLFERRADLFVIIDSLLVDGFNRLGETLQIILSRVAGVRLVLLVAQAFDFARQAGDLFALCFLRRDQILNSATQLF